VAERATQENPRDDQRADRRLIDRQVVDRRLIDRKLIDRQLIERLASALAAAGMTRMPARVFAALLVTDSARLTAADLAQVLQVSPAAISGAVRYLIQLNLATRECEPGSRRDHYRLLDDVWYEATLRREQIITQWDSAAREAIQALGADTPAGARLAETLAYFEFLREEVPGILKRWHERRAQLHSHDQ
jgi:DNA-binding transcriptional regulator GbsR (MarR family)